MNKFCTLKCIFLSLFLSLSNAQQTHHPIFSILQLPHFPNTSSTFSLLAQLSKSNHTHFRFGPSFFISSSLCFISASISSAGGIGGGGLYIPILAIIAGMDLKSASSFSAFMVTGGSIANVLCSFFAKNSKHGDKNKIDFDIALLSEPSILLGVSIGVICNVSFPEWLITVMFAVFLAWSTYKTWKTGIKYWKMESESKNENENENKDENEEDEEMMIMVDENGGGLPWRKLGVLVVIWLCFFLVYVFRGNKYGQSITQWKACGVGYWILSSLQIPLAFIFTAWILRRKDSHPHQVLHQQEIESRVKSAPPEKLIFPIMALSAGFLGGLFGIGGGMLISPLLLQVGIAPEVTAATCSFMVFFSSTMSACQYLFIGMENTEAAVILAIICFVGSLLGLLVVQTVIQKHGRASIIVFSVGMVMALSTVLLTCFGASDVWKDYKSGKYMGFRSPC